MEYFEKKLLHWTGKSVVLLSLAFLCAPLSLNADPVSLFSALPPPTVPVISTPYYDSRSDPKSPHYNPDYDPNTDASHPLKNKDQDPGNNWDNNRRADGTPNVKQKKGNWNWGEMYYGGTYNTKLIVTNECNSIEPVTVFVNNLPYIKNLQENLMVPPGSHELDVTIETPPEPDPPLRLGLPGEPTLESWGHVDFSGIFIAPGQSPPHQPNFEQVDGEVVLWHPWGQNCTPVRETYKASGHIHFRPPKPEPPPSGPEKLAETDVCEVYWKTGSPPGQIASDDCTEKIRALAIEYFASFLGPYIADAPEQWRWLPGQEALNQMSIGDLLAVKMRAEKQIGII